MQTVSHSRQGIASPVDIQTDPLPHFLRLGQKPAKVVFMNEPASSLVGYGSTFRRKIDRSTERI
jgi:hypothetical protein